MTRSRRTMLGIMAAVFGMGLFALIACGGEKPPQSEDLKDLVYNEAGGFYEQKSDNVISVTFLPQISSMYHYEISIEYDDENLIFSCFVEAGHFTSGNGQVVELKSGEYCRWGFDTYREETWDQTIYVDIVAKVEDKIAGYGVIGFFPKASDLESSCKVLKFAFIPQVGGVWQPVTENQTKNAMKEIKNN